MSDFYGLGIAPQLLDILQQLRFSTPTPIQEKAIPIAIQGKDIVGIAQTGTGKTLAFGLPMVQRLAQTGGTGLVVLPTRELATQVDETIKKFTRQGTAILIGGASMEKQMQMLRRNPRIIIGTPGRIIDHLERRTLRLDAVKILVLDEADRMFDMGFAPQIKRILDAIPNERQTMLFSATMPNDIMRMATKYMQLPLRIEVAPAGTAAQSVVQELFVVKKEDKPRLLEKLLQEYKGTVLVFSRTKHGARKIRRGLSAIGHNAAELHSNLSFNQRQNAMEGFRSGKFRILVATDIAARGIDVSNIELVINYDVPTNPEDYVHRIGRTGRGGAQGKAITFASQDQKREVQDIQRLIRTWIPIAELPELPPARAIQSPEPSFRPSRPYTRRRR